MFRSRIVALDNYYQNLESSIIRLDTIVGRIIYSDEPSLLYTQYDPRTERIATLEEVIQSRVGAFRKLLDAVPELDSLVERIELQNTDVGIKKLLKTSRLKALTELDKHAYGVWKIRPTTSVHMVRALDCTGIDTVFFYNGNPFTSENELIASYSKKISDGGIRYGKNAIKKIVAETPSQCTMAYQDYIKAKGGNFRGMKWLEHPIFSTSIGSPVLMEEYVYAMQVLHLLGFYNQGKHSGWRPGEMKLNYGRPISLGLYADSFYPPNNSTVDHCMIILPKYAKVIF